MYGSKSCWPADLTQKKSKFEHGEFIFGTDLLTKPYENKNLRIYVVQKAADLT